MSKEGSDEPVVKKKRGRKKNIYNTNVEVINSKTANNKILSIVSTGTSKMSFGEFFKETKIESESNNVSEKPQTSNMTAQDRCIINGLNKSSLQYSNDVYKHVSECTDDKTSNISKPPEDTNVVVVNENKDLNNIPEDCIHESHNFSKEHYFNKTDVLCWYCCHSFETYPIPLPIGIKTDKNGQKTYHVKGNFCSFNCAKSYALDTHNYNRFDMCGLLSSLYKSIYTKSKPIVCAPKRDLLKCFGGVLDISEFRDMSNNLSNKMELLPSNIIPINMKLYESNKTIEKVEHNNDLVLYRKAPNKKKNTLEASMGLTKL